MAVSDRTLALQETGFGSFSEWAREAEPRLRHALIASFGSQLGQEASADALTFAWEHWDRVSLKENPLAYLFVIGRNKARRKRLLRRPVFLEVDEQRLPDVEPALPAAVAALSEKQRIAVTLLYGYEWTQSEVAELMGTGRSTVQKHAERGLARLRATMGVEL